MWTDVIRMGICEICGEEDVDLYSLNGYAQCKKCYDATILEIVESQRM
jgi:hypothetical protein